MAAYPNFPTTELTRLTEHGGGLRDSFHYFEGVLNGKRVVLIRDPDSQKLRNASLGKLGSYDWTLLVEVDLG